MKSQSLTPTETSALVSELRAMALLSPGQDETKLRRAREIVVHLNTLAGAGGRIAAPSKAAYSLLEILLSHRRWKAEALSVESLRKDIKSACDRLRVGVEGAFISIPHHK